MIHQTNNIDGSLPEQKPKTETQTLTLSKPAEFSSLDLESLATFLVKSFTKYNLRVEFNTDTDQIELTANRLDGKPILRGSFYHVRRAYLGFIRGWICHRNNHS